MSLPKKPQPPVGEVHGCIYCAFACRLRTDCSVCGGGFWFVEYADEAERQTLEEWAALRGGDTG